MHHTTSSSRPAAAARAPSHRDAAAAAPTAPTRSSRRPVVQCLSTASSTSSSPVDAKGLSYLGDSIWTLCVRRHFFVPPKHWRTYQELVQPYVTAEGQAAMYDALLSGAAGATPGEQQLLAGVRAQVANWRLRKRFDTAAAADAYRKATAFEALIGHLHLHDPQRLVVLAEALLALPASGTPSTDGGQPSDPMPG